MQKKRILALGLSLCMFGGLLAGCGAEEKKPETDKEKTFDYDKLAETIISRMQANNRSANLDKNKNSTDDWLSQLSLKF